jgi:N-acetylglucosamine kinase-like BadF-type ATPase
VARTPDGALHRAGGLGWQMGDEGSGYAMARAALVAVGRARDGRGPATALTERLRSPAAPDLDGLVRWSSSAEPGEIAALAPLVLAEAKAGDPVAAAIVDTAAEELAAHVRALTGHFPGAGRIPVALAGGNLEPGRPLRDPVLTRLAAVSRISVLEGPLDAAMGAIALARRAAG